MWALYIIPVSAIAVLPQERHSCQSLLSAAGCVFACSSALFTCQPGNACESRLIELSKALYLRVKEKTEMVSLRYHKKKVLLCQGVVIAHWSGLRGWMKGCQPLKCMKFFVRVLAWLANAPIIQ